MASKLIFLGTAGDKFVFGKQIRLSGGIIIQINDNQFHIDPGPGALSTAKQLGVNLRANTAVLVSHNHINHCNDLNAVIDAMTYSGLDKKGVVITNHTVTNGHENIKPYLTDFHKNCVEKVITLKPEQKVGIEDVEIYATPAIHSDPNTIGFKFYTPEFVLTYTSDTKYNRDLTKFYKDSDILIINTQEPADSEEKEHNLSSDDAVRIINKVKPRLAIITHFGLRMMKADPLYEAREIQRRTNVQTIAAKDGMVINPQTYSARSRNKTLTTFEEESEEQNNQETN